MWFKEHFSYKTGRIIINLFLSFNRIFKQTEIALVRYFSLGSFLAMTICEMFVSSNLNENTGYGPFNIQNII